MIWDFLIFFSRGLLFFSNLEESKRLQKKAFETFYGNTYLFDQFLGKPLIQIDKWEGSNLQTISFAQTLQYSCIEPSLKEFADWLQQTILEEDFRKRCDLYIDIQKTIKDGEGSGKTV